MSRIKVFFECIFSILSLLFFIKILNTEYGVYIVAIFAIIYFIIDEREKSKEKRKQIEINNRMEKLQKVLRIKRCKRKIIKFYKMDFDVWNRETEIDIMREEQASKDYIEILENKLEYYE